MTTATATTPTEMGIMKPAFGTKTVEQYSKRIYLIHSKGSYIGNETCL